MVSGAAQEKVVPCSASPDASGGDAAVGVAHGPGLCAPDSEDRCKSQEAADKDDMSVKLQKVGADGHVDPLIYKGTTEQLEAGKGAPPPVHWHVFWAAGAANLIALAAGCVLCWTSPSLPKFMPDNSTAPPVEIANVTFMRGSGVNATLVPFAHPVRETTFSLLPSEAAWVGSLTPLGAAIGPIPAGILADKLGRKPTLLGDSVLLLLSWVLIAAAGSASWLYAARFIAGVATGCIFTVLPMYIGEIATDSVRSTLGSLMQLSLTVGFMVPFAIGPYVSPMWLAIGSGLVPVLFAAAFFAMPESPYVLLARGDTLEASDALQWLRGQDRKGIIGEMRKLEEETQEALAKKKPLVQSFFQIFATRGNIKAFYFGCGLLFFQQFSGINAVLFYAQDIFKKTGSSLAPEICTIIIGLVQIAASAGTLALTARFSMKALLIFSGFGMAAAHAALGYFFHLLGTGQDISAVGALPVGSLVFYIIVYCFGFGPLPWAVMGEVFAPDVKAISSSVCASFCWLLGFLITLFFAQVEHAIGGDMTFWALAAFCVLASLFTFLLPNTRGKSLQEIQDMLNGR
ncbi:facilitated trehalose transporter Tret1 [Frankliniella occidentalis]|uniref:Facilitated trehalose transporter Tret1 n=1 Tax=Frankliniella occidentalis TaxID=133901 RepID=A0A9C6WMU2_FRAOC|nr:facilitated trehalose transporter Tret1 [Frankliniella occidentalis]